ncbi:hypothetical protein ASPCAL01052 [Aspergillus calidoustus]|uniref:Uncharacterized protein n=1 Tax=Aspergillus calidoustus TaxID=454130 RepID=A0A0U5FT74_ASPCI|nr:hypothetical protein ASPCAL01052 [Aspergillus calidoustus]
MDPSICATQIQTPLSTAIHLLVTLFVAASYIPQLVKITTTGDAGISGWYIILLTTSATTHFATRIKNIHSSFAWACFRDGELTGFNLFSALVIYLQAFTHWAAAIILLALYISSRSGTRALAKAPSNIAILAIVLAHAVIILALAIYFLDLLTQEGGHDDVNIIIDSFVVGLVFRFTGLVTSLAAAIPQIRTMVTRYHDNGNKFNQGSLSLLGLGLQVMAFIALGASQGWRMRPLPPGPDPEIGAPDMPIWSLIWWEMMFLIAGLAAGWVALAVCQLLVLCVALGLGARGERGNRLSMIQLAKKVA